jgi:orotidine-5'-phosphate decarboxylase
VNANGRSIVPTPDVPVILDVKLADIGNTNEGYAREAFDYYKADAMTVHPYLGKEALQPFLDRKDKGIFVLCRTSNPGAGEFQDRFVNLTPAEIDEWGLMPGTRLPLYQLVAYRVSREWNTNDNCGLVVGATYPEELRQVRGIVGDMPLLIPGIGAQGGDVEATVNAGRDSHGHGMIINSSRSIIFASAGPNYTEAARQEAQKLHDMIRQTQMRSLLDESQQRG